MKQVVADLLMQGLIKLCVHSDHEISRQIRAYEKIMLGCAHHDMKLVFLAEYDAMMRLVEIVLLLEGCRLGNTPHQVMKIVVRRLEPLIEVGNIAQLRHSIKKTGFTPSIQDNIDISNLRELLYNRVKYLF